MEKELTMGSFEMLDDESMMSVDGGGVVAAFLGGALLGY